MLIKEIVVNINEIKQQLDESMMLSMQQKKSHN